MYYVDKDILILLKKMITRCNITFGMAISLYVCDIVVVRGVSTKFYH